MIESNATRAALAQHRGRLQSTEQIVAASRETARELRDKLTAEPYHPQADGMRTAIHMHEQTALSQGEYAEGLRRIIAKLEAQLPPAPEPESVDVQAPADPPVASFSFDTSKVEPTRRELTRLREQVAAEQAVLARVVQLRDNAATERQRHQGAVDAHARLILASESVTWGDPEAGGAIAFHEAAVLAAVQAERNVHLAREAASSAERALYATVAEVIYQHIEELAEAHNESGSFNGLCRFVGAMDAAVDAGFKNATAHTKGVLSRLPPSLNPRDAKILAHRTQYGLEFRALSRLPVPAAT